MEPQTLFQHLEGLFILQHLLRGFGCLELRLELGVKSQGSRKPGARNRELGAGRRPCQVLIGL